MGHCRIVILRSVFIVFIFVDFGQYNENRDREYYYHSYVNADYNIVFNELKESFAGKKTLWQFALQLCLGKHFDDINS